MVKCERCGCEDLKYFGNNNGKLYCRRCILFKGEIAKSSINNHVEIVQPFLRYPLSIEQDKISKEILDGFINRKNIFLHAVCGAGKTELVYRTIAYCLSNNLQVGFCIPRRDVVIELAPRIQEAFPTKKIVSVYGGNTTYLQGDVIVLTSHQLYRYIHYFDFLIMDETDAFPFANNDVLWDMFFRSIRGNYLLMSATPFNYMIDKIRKEGGIILKLMKRYHGHPLIVPKVILTSFFVKFYTIKATQKFVKENKPVFIFAPTIVEAKELYSVMKIFIKKGNVVHSKSESRERIIEDFKNGKYLYLVTTSILERGVTIKNLQVIVYKADHSFFSDNTLVQISGRVGRKIDSPNGEVIYIANKETKEMKDSIENIKRSNEYAFL